MLADDAIEEFTAAQAEPGRGFETLPQEVVLAPPGRVGQNIISGPDAEEGLDVSGSGVIGMKPAGERGVNALDCVFVGLGTEPQDLVVIGRDKVFAGRPGGHNVQRQGIFWGSGIETGRIHWIYPG